MINEEMTEWYEVNAHPQGADWKLTQAAWFQVFLTGKLDDVPIQWIQRKGDPSKRVTFPENLNVF